MTSRRTRGELCFEASPTYRKSGGTFRSGREANTCGDANFSRQRRNYLQQPSGRVRENTSTSSLSSKQLLVNYRTSRPSPLCLSFPPRPVGHASLLQFLGDKVRSYATPVCMRNCARARAIRLREVPATLMDLSFPLSSSQFRVSIFINFPRIRNRDR